MQTARCGAHHLCLFFKLNFILMRKRNLADNFIHKFFCEKYCADFVLYVSLIQRVVVERMRIYVHGRNDCKGLVSKKNWHRIIIEIE